MSQLNLMSFRETSNFVEILRERAIRQPNVTAYEFLLDGDELSARITYSELDRKARAIGAFLQSFGCSGERILLLYPPSLEYVAAYFGCLYGGGIAVPAYPPTSTRLIPRLQAIAKNAEAVVALTSSKLLDEISDRFEKVPELNRLTWVATDALPKRLETLWKEPQITWDTLAFLQYTSGSTSIPKGVMVTHGNLIHNSKMIQTAFEQGTDDRGVIWLPPYHDMGLIGGILQPLYAGYPVTLMSPYDFMQRPYSWLKAISRTKATTSGGPNFAYDLCVERITEDQKRTLDLSSWRVAFNGAEPIRASTLERFADEFACCGFKPEAFFPCYGLAEGTLIVTGGWTRPLTLTCNRQSLEEGYIGVVHNSSPEDKSKVLVSSGKSLMDQKVCIVDPTTFTECKEGEIGEIWVKGPSVAQGYWSMPELTDESFRAYLLKTGEGPFLRTGDMGFLYEGNLFVTGRMKDLIIIRGRNLYPQDIELTAEKSHPAARPNAAAAFAITVEDEERLVIVQEVQRKYRALVQDEMVDAITQEILREYGVQPYAVVLVKFGGIPKTSSGKIQRGLTRERFLAGELNEIGRRVYSNEVSDSVEDLRKSVSIEHGDDRRAEIERIFLNLLSQTTGVTQSVADLAMSPSELGIDSMKAFELQHVLEEEWGVMVPAVTFLQDMKLEDIRDIILTKLDMNYKVLPVDHGIQTGLIPASRGQKGLYFLQKLAPHSSAYHIARAVKIRGPLQTEKVRNILQILTARHTALRTTFIEDQNGGLLQKIADEPRIEFTYVEAASWSDQQRLDLLVAETQRPFDLESGPLMRTLLLNCSTEEHLLLWVFHHIIVDLWSVDVLIEETITLLELEGTDSESLLPMPAMQFRDYTVWQESWLKCNGEEHLAYWLRELTGELPVLDFPSDRPRPPVQTYNGSSCTLTLGDEQTKRLKELSAKHNGTLYMTLLAAYLLFLYRYTGQNEIIIGSPMAGRTRAAMNKLVGFVTNTLPLRFFVREGDKVADLISQVRGKVLGAFAHQEYPFHMLLEKVNPKRDSSRSPVYQTVFVMQNVGTIREAGAIIAGKAGGISTLGGLQVETVPLPETSSLFDLTTTVTEVEDRLILTMQYNTDLFEEKTVTRMLHHFTVLLDSLTTNEEEEIDRLPMLTEEERQELLPTPIVSELPHRTLVELFEEQVLATPEKVAISYQDRSLTYSELDARANRLARLLQEKGVLPGDKVGIFVERSLEMIVGILGILKAGAAYVPLDPFYPQERLEFVIEDAELSLLLTQEHLLERLRKRTSTILLLKDVNNDISREDTQPLRLSLSPDHLAYVIYTSGSTGKPKGVLVSHGNVVRLFESTDHLFQFNQEDVWTLFHSYAFDFSVWEIWGALLKGGRLVVVPYMVSRHPEEFYRLLHREGVTVLNQTPSAFQQLIYAEERSEMKLPLLLRYVIFGGEVLSPESLRPWVQRHGCDHPKLINMYGITETTVHVTYRQITLEDLSRQNSLIGVPIRDLQVYLLDRNMQPVPYGVIGEMYIGGPGVAQGYMNRPELTAEKFIANPFVADTGAKLYRSGDLARRLSNGELEYVGRFDHQVKIRGFRIELGEIKSALLQREEVREAVVLAHVDRTGEKVLVAYIVLRNMENVLKTSELKNYLRSKLPEFMVPAHFVILDRIPLTENGKIDMQALPAPQWNDRISSFPYVAPSGPIEETLASVWSHVLGVERISALDNFFDLGGDSIRSIRVLTLAKEFGIHLSLQDLYRYQTIRELAFAAGQSNPSYEVKMTSQSFALLKPEDRRLVPDGIEDAYPLTSLQAGLVFHSEYNPDYKNYITTFRLKAPFNDKVIRQALERLTARHPMLRTSFDVSRYSVPMQLVHKKVIPRLIFNDWRDKTPEQQEAGFTEFLHAEKRNKFDWKEAPLLRFNVHRLTDETLQFTMTEPFLDGWSVASLITELFSDYLALLKEPNTPPLPLLESTFRDYVAAEKHALENESSKAYWENELRDCMPTHLPRWGRRPDEASAAKDRIWVPIPKNVSEGLRQMAKSASLPLKSVLLAAHLRVVSLLGGQTDVLTGMFQNGRLEQYQGEKVVGLFLNTVPLRAKLSSGSRWVDLARQAFEKERDLLSHRRFPLAELQRLYGGRQQLFETAFNYTHFHVYEGLTELPGLEVLDAEHTDYTFITLTAQFTVDVNSGDIHLALDYNPYELNAEQMDQIAAYYQNVLTAMTNDPTGRYDKAPLLSPQELQKMLVEWNNTSEYEETDLLCVHQLVEQQAARTPDRIVVIEGERTLTYRELDAKANGLAIKLKNLGVGPDKLVGLCMERSLEMVIGLLGILKAGAAYVPLDPSYPKERLEFMIKDADLIAIVTQKELLQELHDPQVSVLLPDDIQEESDPPVIDGLSPENLAYVIYTSGSTGKPKGVQVPHRGVVNFLLSMQNVPGLQEHDVMVAVTSISFDIAALELYLPLITGAKLVLASKEVVADGHSLAELLEREQVTVMQGTPATWNLLLQAGWSNKGSLKVLCGGEPLTVDLARKLSACSEEVWNLYGPTETTIWSTLHKITSMDGPILIGRPIRNTEVYLLDSFGQPVPVGVPGELCIGGAGVTRGYLKRPDLTQAKFVKHPFSDNKEARLYRTGDLARYLPDGSIEYLGRLDDQLKIRGFRIELGEIETCLGEHEAVQQAVVVLREVRAEEKSLVAYVVMKPEYEPDTGVLRRHLKERLPAYMVPSFYVPVEKFPLLPNGKLNRKALPAPDWHTLECMDTLEEPQTEVEKRIAGIWQDVLGYEKVGRNQDFYDLGGHSLLATQLISRLREAFGVDLSLRSLLEGSTVAKLAQEIEGLLLLREEDEDLTDLLDLVEGLSDEEVKKLLSEKGGSA